MRVQRSEAIAFAALFIALGGTGLAAVEDSGLGAWATSI